MKTKTILTILSSLFLFGIGCENDNRHDEQIQLRDFSYFGCKEKTDKISSSKNSLDSKTDNQEYLEYKAIKEGYLYIKHVNVLFNCCPDTIKTTISSDVNEIKIIESETGAKCNCICDYDLAYKIGPLSPKKYTISICRDSREYTRFTITYHSSLEGKFVIQK